ncbi:metal-sulfur cluster assembly factor [Pontibacter qinzhouensis]|uniref:Metal-sulfur cluster assembly factor n=1 Tax=Pontibacter qinzhouensis TaxID=2603253 RepID=A0A5C8J6U6_9BACT|nr:metal-sulfur cluster assembly factor [Pontibacter qinzhouensis]TXK32814.1 metal-sulfur cluster assembly factor [Pontibacter qinzhouensis]
METQAPDTGEQVFETLKYIIDPEVGINIVDLGLIYKVSLQEKVLTVELTLTTPGCPMGSTIITAVEQILSNRFPELQVQVELVWSPPWSTDMISEEGMRELNGV